MVFITGTPANKGRVASHPRKGMPIESPPSTSRKQSKSRTRAKMSPRRDAIADLVPTQPLSSAWEDHITLTGTDYECNALVTALPVPLGSVFRDNLDAPGGTPFSLVLPPYNPSEIPSRIELDEISTGGQCLVHVPGLDDAEAHSESYCVFLFEVGLLSAPPLQLRELDR